MNSGSLPPSTVREVGEDRRLTADEHAQAGACRGGRDGHRSQMADQRSGRAACGAEVG